MGVVVLYLFPGTNRELDRGRPVKSSKNSLVVIYDQRGARRIEVSDTALGFYPFVAYAHIRTHSQKRWTLPALPRFLVYDNYMTR